MNTSNRIRSTLKSLRKEQKLSLQTLSTATNLSLGTLHNVENKEDMDPGLSTVLAVAQALGTNLILDPTDLRSALVKVASIIEGLEQAEQTSNQLEWVRCHKALSQWLSDHRQML